MDADLSREGYKNRWQGNFGEGYVRALATAARLSVAKEEPEPKGIDFTISREGIPGARPKRRIEVSVKSTRTLDVSQKSLVYKLKLKDFNELSGSLGVDYDVPRYLVVVIVPDVFSSYCAIGDDSLSLRHRAYWVDLMGSATPTSKGDVPVSLAAENILSVESLVRLIAKDEQEVRAWMSE